MGYTCWLTRERMKANSLEMIVVVVVAAAAAVVVVESYIICIYIIVGAGVPRWLLLFQNCLCFF